MRKTEFKVDSQAFMALFDSFQDLHLDLVSLNNYCI